MSAISQYPVRASGRDKTATENAARPTSVSKSSARFYYPELDTIRFFLFLGVWSYHALPREENIYVAHHVPGLLAFALSSIVKAGMCTLDVFFILSAFLITELLLREREIKGRADLKMFYIRRLLRIWPLYFFMIILAGLISIFDSHQVLTTTYALAFLLFTGNWIISINGYPGAGIIGPLWSVSFEEQFYLLWPLVLRKAGKRTLYITAVALLLVGALTRLILLLAHQRGDQIWYDSFVRLDSIAYGILVALILHHRATLRIRLLTRLALLLMGSAMWVLASRGCRLDDRTLTLVGGMVGYPLMSLGAVAIFLSVLGASDDGVPFLKHPALVYLGKIAYGLYAYHMLGLKISKYLFRNFTQFAWTYSSICALAITFLLAAASFKWLESPFLRLKQKKFTHVPSGPPLESQELRVLEGSEHGPMRAAGEVAESLSGESWISAAAGKNLATTVLESRDRSPEIAEGVPIKDSSCLNLPIDCQRPA